MIVYLNQRHGLKTRLSQQVFAHTPTAISLSVLVILCICSLFAPVIEFAMGQNANSTDLFNRYQSPSITHPLGTDELGRDLFLRLLYGGQVSLLVGITSSLCAGVIGTFLGISAGYFGGYLDSLLMRITDSVISLPLLPLLIVLAAIDVTKLGIPTHIAEAEYANLYRIIILISFVSWTTVARLVRASTLSLKKQTYVLAAEAQGARPIRIMFVHILPNLTSTIIVATTLATGNVILLESVLSFLGFGLQPPIPSWGNLLTNAQALIWEAPMQAVYPGVLIFLTVISLNFLGDGLQRALDPRTL